MKRCSASSTQEKGNSNPLSETVSYSLMKDGASSKCQEMTIFAGKDGDDREPLYSVGIAIKKIRMRF